MKEIKLGGKLGQGKVALVDDDDYAYLSQFSWYLSTNGYTNGRKHLRVRSTIDGKGVKLHRVVMGVTDPKLTVDHINGNVLDNRKENLQILSFQDHARLEHARGKYKNRKKKKCDGLLATSTSGTETSSNIATDPGQQ